MLSHRRRPRRFLERGHESPGASRQKNGTALGHVQVADGRARVEGATGVEVVDHALTAASDVLTQDGLELTVKVSKDGIDVTIVGGTWEGGRFQARLCQAIGFAERGAAALRTRYRGRDPASPKVALTDDVVVITDREPTTVHAR
jgi:hypothetical protein